tara:strand:- start:63473 stop:64210 length:738 start_codon:yes stop_codon:yes gene_type:complete
MLKSNLPILKVNEQEQLVLKAKIELVQSQLNEIEQQTIAFEAILRSNLENQLIEEQELTILYKKIQQVKKEKRLNQKKKGKNYKEIIGLKVIAESKVINANVDDLKEKKRLYREAMLHVHPDKFSLNATKLDIATEITAKLIEIYQSGSLNELQIYHTHIFSGNALLQFIKPSLNSSTKIEKDIYLIKELAQLEKVLLAAKNKHTYKVLTEYKNPLTFIDELKEYYRDRIFKLKKRTRKATKFDL